MIIEIKELPKNIKSINFNIELNDDMLEVNLQENNLKDDSIIKLEKTQLINDDISNKINKEIKNNINTNNISNDANDANDANNIFFKENNIPKNREKKEIPNEMLDLEF